MTAELKPICTEFEKALVSLKVALSSEKTDLHRDASIQRFEFCVKLAWKTTKTLMGSASTAPKVVIREMASQNLIADTEIWFNFLDARGESSHTYKEEVATQGRPCRE